MTGHPGLRRIVEKLIQKRKKSFRSAAKSLKHNFNLRFSLQEKLGKRSDDEITHESIDQIRQSFSGDIEKSCSPQLILLEPVKVSVKNFNDHRISEV